MEQEITISRKKEEQEFHNRLRSGNLKSNKKQYDYYKSNVKYYSVDRGNRQYVNRWLEQRCAGRRVLDYCCGDGRYTFTCAEYGADAVGIDISDVSIENCKRSAAEKGLEKRSAFFVMDAEEMKFEDNYFDIILCMGVLHHLDFRKALKELSRVLKPDGKIICTEALGHNPLIQLYRRVTPHLRTEFEAEHILKMSDLKMAEGFFGSIKTSFFHLATIAAVPLRKTPVFDGFLEVMEGIDRVLLRLPVIRTMAWMVIFELSNPKNK